MPGKEHRVARTRDNNPLCTAGKPVRPEAGVSSANLRLLLSVGGLSPGRVLDAPCRPFPLQTPPDISPNGECLEAGLEMV